MKFVMACCIFSFITGAYAVEMLEKNKDKGCTVSIGHGKETHVLIGRAL